MKEDNANEFEALKDVELLVVPRVTPCGCNCAESIDPREGLDEGLEPLLLGGPLILAIFLLVRVNAATREWCDEFRVLEDLRSYLRRLIKAHVASLLS